MDPVVFPYRFNMISPTELHIKLMEYNINLPANLSQKKRKSTTLNHCTENKSKERKHTQRNQITNSKKLKMYRKNKWNWMRNAERWKKKRLLNVLVSFSWSFGWRWRRRYFASNIQWKLRALVSWQMPWTKKIGKNIWLCLCERCL